MLSGSLTAPHVICTPSPRSRALLFQVRNAVLSLQPTVRECASQSWASELRAPAQWEGVSALSHTGDCGAHLVAAQVSTAGENGAAGAAATIYRRRLLACETSPSLDDRFLVLQGRTSIRAWPGILRPAESVHDPLPPASTTRAQCKPRFWALTCRALTALAPPAGQSANGGGEPGSVMQHGSRWQQGGRKLVQGTGSHIRQLHKHRHLVTTAKRAVQLFSERAVQLFSKFRLARGILELSEFAVPERIGIQAHAE